jgi:hypothetical protein
MRRAATLLRALLVALPLAGAACDDNETYEAMELARKVVFDLTTTRFRAIRHFGGDFGGQQADWVEQVTSNGDGKNVLVELLARNGLERSQITDPAELVEFDRLAAQLATGGGPRVLFQRDPAPDDLERMLANYEVTLVETSRMPITPRGEPTLTYRVESPFADRPFYLLTVSTHWKRQGFPLHCQEFVQDVSGPRLVSEMVVTSIEWTVEDDVLSPTSPIVSRLDLDSLNTARSRAASQGVTLFLPFDSSLPSGFELVRIEEVALQTDANRSRTVQDLILWRFVYSDGVEHIDFIEHAPTNAMPAEFVDGPDGAGVDLALMSTFGSITIGSLIHAHTQVTIESRIAADRFGTLLRSLVPL